MPEAIQLDINTFFIMFKDKLLFRTPVFCFISLCLMSSCEVAQREETSYRTEILEWKDKRIKGLTSALGWTSLIGLYPIPEGISTIGASADNGIVFPKGTPTLIGKVYRHADSISLDISSDLPIKVDNQIIKKAHLLSDADGKPSMVNLDALYWYVIKRGQDYFFRLKDTLNPARFELKEIPSFRIDKSWRVAATVIEPKKGEMITIDNALGQQSQERVAAYLSFNYRDKSYMLTALDGGATDFFVILADATTGVESYDGGRFMYVKRPKVGENTIIDFNKAYNPPCVFSDFATCPLPPKENRLDFAITAGEKVLDGHQ